MAGRLVHIGYHKTATTWFQRRFYPRVRNVECVERRRIAEAFLAPRALEFSAEAARAALGLRDDRIYVLCEEELSGSPTVGGLHGLVTKEVAHRLKAALPGARVVIFIRSQTDIVAAVYGEYVRRGGTHRPDRFLFPERRGKGQYRRPYRAPMFSFGHFDYLPVIRHYESVFGAAAVHVFPYEEFRADPAAFLRHYAEVLGLDVEIDALSFEPAYESYGRRLLPIARAANHFTARSEPDKRYVANVLPFKALQRGLHWLNGTAVAGDPPRPGDLLGADTLAYVRERFAESNAALARHRDLPLHAYGYPGCSEEPVADQARPAARSR